MSLPVLYHEATCVMTIGYPESKTRQLKRKTSLKTNYTNGPLLLDIVVFTNTSTHQPASTLPSICLQPRSHQRQPYYEPPDPTLYPPLPLYSQPTPPLSSSRLNDTQTHKFVELACACVSPSPHAEHRFVTPVFWRACLWVLAKPRTWAGRTGWRRGLACVGKVCGGWEGVGGGGFFARVYMYTQG